jgi:hypothetical protein
LDIQEVLRLAAFTPSCRDGVGNGVYLLFRDGSHGWANTGLRSFVKRLATVFTINLQESRRIYGQVIGQRNLIPLVLAPRLIYVPVKTRFPEIKGDPAYGYFRLRSILAVYPGPGPCTLALEGGHKVEVMQSYRTIRKRLGLVRDLEAGLLDNFFQALDIYQAEPAPAAKKEGCGALELRNRTEIAVRASLKALLRNEPELCICQECCLNMAAQALNRLPPRYVVGSGDDFWGPSEASRQEEAAVRQAITAMRRKPGHEQEDRIGKKFITRYNEKKHGRRD